MPDATQPTSSWETSRPPSSGRGYLPAAATRRRSKAGWTGRRRSTHEGGSLAVSCVDAGRLVDRRQVAPVLVAVAGDPAVHGVSPRPRQEPDPCPDAPRPTQALCGADHRVRMQVGPLAVQDDEGLLLLAGQAA